MKVMSSQMYRNDDIVEEKVRILKECEVDKIIIPIVNAFTKDLAGEDLYIVANKHHEMSAAIILGIPVEFEEVDNDLSDCKEIKNQDGEAVCRDYYMGDDWYYVDTDEPDGIRSKT